MNAHYVLAYCNNNISLLVLCPGLPGHPTTWLLMTLCNILILFYWNIYLFIYFILYVRGRLNDCVCVNVADE